MNLYEQNLKIVQLAPTQVQRGYWLCRIFYNLLRNKESHLFREKEIENNTQYLFEIAAKNQLATGLNVNCTVCLIESTINQKGLYACPFKISEHAPLQPCAFNAFQWLLSNAVITEIQNPKPASGVCFAGEAGLRPEYEDDDNPAALHLPTLIFQDQGAGSITHLIPVPLLQQIRNDLNSFRDWGQYMNP